MTNGLLGVIEKLEGGELVNHVDIWEMSITGRGNSHGKGSEERVHGIHEEQKERPQDWG